MSDLADELEWAPRLRPDRLRRLYELDARGIVDDELVDDVAWTLYARCRSILEATEAALGRVTCPRCRRVILRQASGERDEVVACDACGWQMGWLHYQASYRGRQLVGGSATPAFAAFVRTLPGARDARQKMVLVDRLIHAYHQTITGEPSRTAAVNLIEGTMTSVIALLQKLSYGDGSDPEALRARDEWQAALARMWAVRRRVAERVREA